MLEHVPLRLEGGWTQNPGTESLAASEHSLSHRTARTQKHTKTHTVKYQKCALSTPVVPLLQCWSKVKICLHWTQVSRVLLVVNRLVSLRWRHNERDGVSNHQPHGCLLKRLFRRRSKRTSKLLVTGLCEGNSPVAAVNSPHKGPVTRKMFPFDDVIMLANMHRDHACHAYVLLKAIWK